LASSLGLEPSVGSVGLLAPPEGSPCSRSSRSCLKSTSNALVTSRNVSSKLARPFPSLRSSLSLCLNTQSCVCRLRVFRAHEMLRTANLSFHLQWKMANSQGCISTACRAMRMVLGGSCRAHSPATCVAWSCCCRPWSQGAAVCAVDNTCLVVVLACLAIL
jgi:hypothetical protein